MEYRRGLVVAESCGGGNHWTQQVGTWENQNRLQIGKEQKSIAKYSVARNDIIPSQTKKLLSLETIKGNILRQDPVRHKLLTQFRL